MQSSPSRSRLLLLTVMLALLIWGGYHIIGGLLSEDARRGLIVFVSFLLFLGTWAVLLLRREKRSKTDRGDLPGQPESPADRISQNATDAQDHKDPAPDARR